MTDQQRTESAEEARPKFAGRIKRLLRRQARWVWGCVAAGLALLLTSAVTDFGNVVVGAAAQGYCRLTTSPEPDPSKFRVVVARLENDADGEMQKRIAGQLVPATFSVLQGCTEGPDIFAGADDTFDERARREATAQLQRLSGDVLIFGRVEDDKIALRFADRNGYCSDVAATIARADIGSEAARGAFAKALTEPVLRSLFSDCKGKKLDALSETELAQVAGKIQVIVKAYDSALEPHMRNNLWTYRAWALARLARLRHGDAGAEQILDDVVANAPDPFAKAASLWGLVFIANKADLEQLSAQVRDEAYVATQNWESYSPAWVSVAMLARERLDQEHAGDAAWRLAHYDRLTDLVAGQGEEYVPMPDGEVDRSYYRFARAVIDSGRPSDVQVENAVAVLRDLVEKKEAGTSVPVTGNSLRFGLAEALALSAQRQRAPSRLSRAWQLLRHIEDNPDDSSELTPAVLAELRNKLRAECARQRCTLDMA